MRLVRRQLLIPLLALVTLSCEKSITEPPDSASCGLSVGTVTIASAPGNSSTSGALTSSSCKLGRGSYADRYQFVLGAMASVDILVSSTDFDAFLILRDNSDKLITSDDDFGPDTDARLNFPMNAGTYYILATTFEDDVVGNYTVTITVSAP